MGGGLMQLVNSGVGVQEAILTGRPDISWHRLYWYRLCRPDTFCLCGLTVNNTINSYKNNNKNISVNFHNRKYNNITITFYDSSDQDYIYELNHPVNFSNLNNDELFIKNNETKNYFFGNILKNYLYGY